MTITSKDTRLAGNTRRESFKIGFAVFPEFNMMALVSAIEPLRVANLLTRHALYRWQLCSFHGETLPASNDLVIATTGSVTDVAASELVFICTSWHPEMYGDAEVLAWLRQLARQEVRIGAIDTGALVLARAGLLEGYRATAHYNVLAGFSEAYPKVRVTDHIYEIDRNRLTCGAGTAPLDLTLSLIREQHGHVLAERVAHHVFHDKIRASGEQQLVSADVTDPGLYPQVKHAIVIMKRNIETPLAIANIARDVGFSVRRLERQFYKHFGVNPQKYYINLRLDLARQYLTHTSMKILDVAIACGFTSQEHFARTYKARYGLPPLRDRAVGRSPMINSLP